MKLNNNWNFRIVSNLNNEELPNNFDKNKWLPAEVPGTIHTDLIKNNIIDNPFYSNNELQLEWIHKSDWEYELQFEHSTTDLNDEYFLLFKGLDTIAEIRLNGELLGVAKNMFIEHSYNVTNLLKAKNCLNVRFQSPKNYGKNLENQMGKLPVALDSERVYLRKAQYSFGWDWGPAFPTVGIWKDVFLLKKLKVQINDVEFKTLSIDNKQAQLSVKFSLAGKLEYADTIEVSLELNGFVFIKKIKNISTSNFTYTFSLDNPKLWYPNGMGKAELYLLTIKIFDKEKIVINKYSKNVGIRKTELVLKNYNGTNTFYFKINGIKTFVKGVNWIPADSFLPRTKNSKYKKLLSLAKNANVNMIRVWGGGIYENDEFYDLCDKLGLLVWQDFMFACAAYPEDNNFIESVTEEIIQNVKRLRHHASIAVWCGNNENEWIWTQNQSLPIEKMPGYKIYHNLIPELLQKLDSTRQYWPSSPFGTNKTPNSPDVGNTHQWDIWSMWKDYEEIKNDKSNFVTEFGFQGPANIDTFKKYLPAKNCKIQDSIFEFHNKQIEGPERLTRFLAGHLPLVTEFDDYIYLTQLNQGFALKTCIEHWRSNDVTNGSIIWQLNDCWPVTSWSLVDSETTPKLSYHFVKNAFNNLLILFTEKDNDLSLYINNSNSKEFNGSLTIAIFELNSSNVIEEVNIEVSVGQGESKIILNECFEKTKSNSNLIFVATLYNKTKEIINRNYFIKEKWKHKKLFQPNITCDFSKIDENKIIIRTDKLALFVDLYHPSIVFEERGFILLEGESKEVSYSKLMDVPFREDKLVINMLNKYLQFNN